MGRTFDLSHSTESHPWVFLANILETLSFKMINITFKFPNQWEKSRILNRVSWNKTKLANQPIITTTAGCYSLILSLPSPASASRILSSTKAATASTARTCTDTQRVIEWGLTNILARVPGVELIWTRLRNPQYSSGWRTRATNLNMNKIKK